MRCVNLQCNPVCLRGLEQGTIEKWLPADALDPPLWRVVYAPDENGFQVSAAGRHGGRGGDGAFAAQDQEDLEAHEVKEAFAQLAKTKGFQKSSTKAATSLSTPKAAPCRPVRVDVGLPHW